MENPWHALIPDKGQYVLDEDFECLKRHNLSASDSNRFMLDSIPEPFIGNPSSARVVLLGKNPGHAADDASQHHKMPDLREAIFRNLRHESEEYAFYPLNPAFAETGVGRWWRTRTQELKKALGGDSKLLAARVMVIEWFPYHSRSFSVPKGRCPSQDYSFALAKEMLIRGTLVVGMRARKLWTKIDPQFERVRFLRNPLCGHISRGNCSDGLFEQIVATLRS